MHISYDKLWKLLLEKRVSKSELHKLTGLSTRTIAKLAKNETVTTDSLLRICEVLDCGIGDIMEVTDGEKKLTLFDAFKKNAVQIGESDIAKTYRLEYEGQIYMIKKTIKTAGNHTLIHCGTDGSVVWNQLLAGGCGLSFNFQTEKFFVTKRDFYGKDEIGILVISGVPKRIDGLDDHGYCSVRGNRKSGDLFVMTYAEFKKYAT